AEIGRALLEQHVDRRRACHASGDGELAEAWRTRARWREPQLIRTVDRDLRGVDRQRGDDIAPRLDRYAGERHRQWCRPLRRLQADVDRGLLPDPHLLRGFAGEDDVNVGWQLGRRVWRRWRWG